MDDVGRPLLREKLRRPGPTGLPRPRVVAALDRIWQHRLGLLLAPAGSGKTTALAQYGAATAELGVPVAWYRADPSDTRDHTVLGYLRTTLLEALDLPQDPTPAADLPDLISDLQTWPGRRALLIVDDLHTVDAPGRIIAQLADLAPEYLRILVASRREPQINAPRLRLDGRLFSVDAGDLRFRPWEVEQLFRRVYAAPLPPEDTARLTRQTAGWAAGLQLFHLATQNKPLAVRRQTVAGLASRSKLVRDYLTRTVLDELPAELADFLIDTAVLGRLSGALCDALLDRTGSGTLLAEIERRDVFLVPLDDAGSYRLHDVLRGHLEELLMERIGERAAMERYAQAGELLEARGGWDEAVRAYCRAERWSDAARLVDGRMINAAPEAPRGPSRANVLDLLPSAIGDHDPWLLLARARDAWAHGDVQSAANRYRRAAEVATAAAPASALGAMCIAERRVAAIWLPEHHGGSDHWSVPLREATRQLTRRSASQRLTPGATATLTHGLVALLAGQFDEALEILADDLNDPATESRSYEVVVARNGEALDGDDPWIPYAALAGATVARLLLSQPVPTDLYASAKDAEVHAMPWLARLISALAGAVAGNLDELAAIVADCGADGDLWGEALVRLFGVIAPAISAPTGWATQAQLILRNLDAEVLATLVRDPAWTMPAPTGAPAAPPRASEEVERCAARLQIRCLGDFQLTGPAGPISADPLRPRARELLRLLTAHGGAVLHRDAIVEALWPGADSRATHNLHVAVSAVRRFLDRHGANGALIRDGHGYRLSADHVWIDVAQFCGSVASARRAGASRDWQHALDAYAGDLLPGDGASEWVTQLREQLRLAAVEAAVALATRQLEEDPAQASITARRGLQIDRYRDQLWRLLIDGLHAAGDQVAAARAQTDYRTILQELGLSGPDLDPQ